MTLTKSDTSSEHVSRRHAAAIPLLLVVVTLAAHWPILFNDFVQLDDGVTVYQNFGLTHLSASSFFSFWTDTHRDLYTPLTYSLFAAVSLIARVRHKAGESLNVPFHAWPFHATSLVLHVICVLLVYALLRRLVRRPWSAAAGALLFALHPVQVETVAWVTETNGLLCGALSLAAVLIYLRSTDGGLPLRGRRGAYILATEFFVLAMLAKPLGVIVPVLAGVLYWIVRRNASAPLTPSPGTPGEGRGEGSSTKSREKPSPYPSPGVPGEGTRGTRIPWSLLLWLILAIPIAIIARLGQPIPKDWLVVPLWFRPLVAADALAFYVGKIIMPITLVPDYNRSPAMILRIGAVYFTWISPVAFAGGIIWLLRRRGTEPVVAGMFWFFAALLPVLGFTTFAFQRMSTVADRYLYLPMFGVALCAAWALSRFAQWSSEDGGARTKSAHRGMVALCVLVLTALGIRTTMQCRYWHDTDSLFKHSVEVIGRTPGALEK